MLFKIKINHTSDDSSAEMIVKGAGGPVEALKASLPILMGAISNPDPALINVSIKPVDIMIHEVTETEETTKPKRKAKAKAKAEKVTTETDPVDLAHEAAAAVEPSKPAHTSAEVQALVASGIADGCIQLQHLLDECKAANISNASQIAQLSDADATMFLTNLRARNNGQS